MIAKIIKGKDFYGVLAYNDQKVVQGQAHVIDANIPISSTVEKTRIFNAIRALRPNLGKAVLHVSLNLPYGDNLSDKDFSGLGGDYLAGMGFDDNQYIMYRHNDQKHHHIHIIANRVKCSGEVVSDAKDLYRSKTLLRNLEKKYGLTQLNGTIVKRESPITQKELEKAIRIGSAPLRYIIQEKVQEAIDESKNTKEFIKNLYNHKIHPKFNISRSTGRVSGISFKYENIIYKGSTLGRGYSWNAIIKTIDYEQDRDRSVVLEANTTATAATGTTIKNSSGTNTNSPRPKGSFGISRETFKKPTHYLGISETEVIDESSYNSFKIELDGPLWGRRRKKRRSR